MTGEQMVKVFTACGIIAADNGTHVNVKQADETFIRMYPAQWSPEDLKRHLIARGAKPINKGV